MSDDHKPRELLYSNVIPRNLDSRVSSGVNNGSFRLRIATRGEETKGRE